jgi:ethanolamine utilization protein EutQ (cupin superfamily)
MGESHSGSGMLWWTRKDSQLLFTTMNNKTQNLNLTITKSKGDDSVVVISDLVDRQPVSHQSIGPKYLTKSCLQSKLDQDDVKIIAPKFPGNVCIQRAATQSNDSHRSRNCLEDVVS